MSKNYDLVAIGTGTAANVAASRCRAAGWRVAVVDQLAFGGTCALRGCDPKRVLVGAAEAVDLVRRMGRNGVDAKAASIDWAALMAFKRTFTDPVPAAVEAGFSKKGIDAYHGLARFKDQRSLQIGDEVLTARFVLIASGAIPARLGIEGEEHVITSTEFLELESLPRRIVFIGGGYVAAELSHIAARAGAAVTILQRGARMLPLFDPTLVEWLTERSREIGMDIRLRTQVLAVERKPSGFVVRGSADAGVREFECDLVVHAAGRVANIEALGVDLAGVETRGGKLVLNDHLQSVSNPAVYAAGDAASKGPPLTPVAAHDARLAASNMLEGNRHKVSYRGIPSVAFTIPPIASVGMSEQQARDGEYKFKVNVERASDWYTARRVAEPLYGFKVLIEEGTGLILGAHLVGPQVGEVINVIALAIRTGMTAKDLRDAVFAYPTGASDIGYMM